MATIDETIPLVDEYTVTPSRLNPATFFEDRETRLSEEATRIPQQNAQAESINIFTSQANSLRSEVNTARDEAVASANVATSGVNYKGDWVAGYATTGYSLNMSVSYTDGYNYRSKVDNNLVEPTTMTNTTEWDYIEAVSPAQLATKVDKVASTDNAIPKFNGTTGQIQNSGVIVDDNDFIITQIFNQDGTEFDGVEYFDAGLLGVPDTVFSSTGARLYPDGTIRGKSSLGEYVKYPDGSAVAYGDCDGGLTTTATASGGGAGGYYSELKTINLPLTFSDTNGTVLVNQKGSSSRVRFTNSAGFSTTSSFKYDVYTINNATGIGTLSQFSAIGEWK